MKPNSFNWKTKLRFLEHGTPTYQTSHAHKRCSTKIKHLPWTSNYWVWSAPRRASFPQWSQKGPLHFIIIRGEKKKNLYISKDWLIHFNIWRQNRCKRCQSWNALPWKHSSLKGYEHSAERGKKPWEIQQNGNGTLSLPAHVCCHPSNQLLLFQVSWRALALHSLVNNSITTTHPQTANAFWGDGVLIVKQAPLMSDIILALHLLGNNY